MAALLDPFNITQQQLHTPIPQAAPKAAAPKVAPNVGPTGFWSRIGQVGVGKVNLYNATKVAKSVGNAATTSEKTVAKGVARVLPGGTNDLKAEQRRTESAAKDVQFIKQQQAQGKMTKLQAGKLLAAKATDAADANKGLNKTVKDMPTRGQLAAGFAGTAADLITAGVGSAAKQGAKFAVEKGTARVATGKLIAKVPEALQAGKKTQIATAAAGSAVSGAAAAKAGGGTGKQALEQGAVGAALPLAALGVGKLIKMGPKAVLEKIKGKAPDVSVAKPTANVMSEEQAGKAAASAHTKVGVDDLSSGSQKVGVKTPLRPGVKEVSTTDKINVRTPQKMSDDEFHGQFNKLSKDYDKEAKQLQTSSKVLPPKTLEMKSKAIDTKYQKQMDDLIDTYHNPQLSDAVAPKSLAKSTSAAGKTIGGIPRAKELKVSEYAQGDRPQNELQTQLEAAHEAGDTKTEATIAAKLGDPALSGGSSAASKIFVDARKAGNPMTMEEARAKAASSGGPATAKTPGLATKIQKDAIEKKLTTGFQDLPEYGSINMKEQASRSADLVASDKQKAIDIATGKTPAPAGLKALSVHQALSHIAKNESDGELLHTLAKSPLTVKTSEGAQDLRILAERDPNDPVAHIKDIAAKRAQAFEKKTGKTVTKAVSDVAKEIDKSVKPVSKFDWRNFVDTIKC